MENKPWNLESFVDALVVELDKTRETLAVKALNKPLSYTVKDMALDLQIFPTYNGDKVEFVTARPGEQGASKVTIKLDSVTDQVVKATSKSLPQKDDIPIESIEVDEDTKKSLRKIGVTSVKDLETIEKKNVDIKKITSSGVNYAELANMIQKSRRNRTPPKVSKVSMSLSAGEPVIVVEGTNLAVQESFAPVAVVNNRLAEIKEAGPERVVLKPPPLEGGRHELVVALDPYSVVKLTLNEKT
ncbi:MAG TPA: hypothetical protein VHK69_02750 [Chitinophagaceae bacterium]|jgi:ribosomal protein L18E|nr:hypothetical protein [Chitinophagaceae bacterium]